MDYAQSVKIYGESPGKSPERKYSPGVCLGAKKHKVVGNPIRAHVSTSHVERQNLAMRMHNRAARSVTV